MEALNLTDIEVKAANSKYNFTDATSRVWLNEWQKEIITNLPKTMEDLQFKSQKSLEEEFAENFFKVRWLKMWGMTNNIIPHYSATMNTGLVWWYAKKIWSSIALTTPTIDYINPLFQHYWVDAEPLHEEYLEDAGQIYKNLSTKIKSDILFIISPNNPTWSALDEKKLQQVIEWAKDYNKVIWIDFAFANYWVWNKWYNLDNPYNPYQHLEEEWVKYIWIEDTWKTFQPEYAKLSLMKSSKDVYEDLYKLSNDHLLSVSKWSFAILNEFAKYSINDKLLSVLTPVLENKQQLELALQWQELLTLQPNDSCVSVARVKISDNTSMNSSEFQQKLASEKDLHILDWKFFFWHDESSGEKYLRISLAREPELFKEWIQKLSSFLNDL